MRNNNESADVRRDVITVAIADDHPIVLDGLEYLFRRNEGFTVVARCENAEEAVRAVAEKMPDVLLLDIRMPGRDGLWVLEQISEQYRTRVILLTGGASDDEIAKALKLGAHGVVLKERTADLVQCIKKVHAGEYWIDKQFLRRIVSFLTLGNVAEAELMLTPRQVDIVELIARGLRNKDIAERLSISEETVKTHLRSIFQKLPVKGRTELAVWARERYRT